MKASFVDLRQKSAAIIRALQRNEAVTVFYRGTPTAIMRPIGDQPADAGGIAKTHTAFGIWADRDDLEDVVSHVRRLRRGRFHAV